MAGARCGRIEASARALALLYFSRAGGERAACCEVAMFRCT